ncbi:NUDIX domain-containing protein [Candidatus Saccharibacteria bacterium]|nr:NUDIX domain-containing protein [Candidatus Saccharibacteria bacterium]
MTMIVQGGEYVFEKRPDNLDAGAAGKLAAYGGQIEWGELADEAAVREAGEETNLKLSPQSLRYLGRICVWSDKNQKPVEVHAHAFEVMLPYDIEVRQKGKAGESTRLSYPEVIDQLDSFSPATLATLKTVYLNPDHEEKHGFIDN